jgi:UDP-N-acetylglucosamine diphosphorylase / glucose-1-phosphate thymidylyltransferase / UDP-N-acetylgalactosamine diphosphorylase / glucosamine-1-phosphate N-acetyltransferase / galactosamine-1-phosphate N-acetyltransferase
VIDAASFIAAFATSPLGRLACEVSSAPWLLVRQSQEVVRRMLTTLPAGDYHIHDDVAVHGSATVEAGAVLKGPLVLGPGCFVAAGAYLRGGSWLDAGCVVGPGVEVKSSFLFANVRLAHFNFVGDSLLGTGVNLEAGSIVCNHRNERADKQILVRLDGHLLGTGVEKFGALLGDRVRIGANAVLAPGTVLAPNAVVGRTMLVDQELGSVG